jgi:hypothetical protein
MTNGGPTPTTKEQRVQDAVAQCCATYRLPDKPHEDWGRTFLELGVSQSELDCVCAALEPYGIQGGHDPGGTTPQMLVNEQTS